MSVTNRKNFSIAVIGHTGRGKTEFTKKLLRITNKPVFVYDVNNEYFGEFHKNKGLPEMKDFLKEATKKTGTNILFEEATIFLSNTGKIEEVRNILVRKRHTQNNIFFVFHSLRSLPVEIADLLDFIVLFHTNDRDTLIKSKFRDDLELTEMFDRVKEKTENTIHTDENFFYYEILSKT